MNRHTLLRLVFLLTVGLLVFASSTVNPPDLWLGDDAANVLAPRGSVPQELRIYVTYESSAVNTGWYRTLPNGRWRFVVNGRHVPAPVLQPPHSSARFARSLP